MFIYEHFSSAYCSTCHSLQRTSSGNITIHEWHISYLASRGWLWCAITRGRDFNSVNFCKNDKPDEETQTNLVLGYFNNKVEGWKKQEWVAGREIDEENYINEDWCWDIVPIYTKKEPAPHRPKNSLPRGGVPVPPHPSTTVFPQVLGYQAWNVSLHRCLPTISISRRTRRWVEWDVDYTTFERAGCF